MPYGGNAQFTVHLTVSKNMCKSLSNKKICSEQRKTATDAHQDGS